MLFQRFVTSLIACALIATSVLAQDAPKEAPEKKADAPAKKVAPAEDTAPPEAAVDKADAKAPELPAKKGEIRFQYDGTPYNDVIKRFAQFANKPILGDVAVEGNLTFFDSQPYTYEEALDTLNLILAMRGSMILESGRYLRVVPVSDLGQMPIRILSGVDDTGDTRPGELVTVMVPVNHIDVESASKAIVPMVSVFGRIAPLTAGKGILITDTLANVKRIRTIINLMDKKADEQAKQAMKSFKLKHAAATTVSTVINTLLRGSTSSSSSSKSRTSTSTKSYVTSSADSRANIVIIRGTADLMAQAEQIVTLLDTEDAAADGNLKVFGLKTASSADVSQAIMTMFGSRSSSSRYSSSGQSVYAYGDTTMNSVMVRAPIDKMKTIEKMIQELDKNVTTFNSVRVFPLRMTSAAAVVPVLTGVLSPRSATNKQQPAQGIVRVAADPATNSVYVSGSPAIIEKAEEIIKQIDKDVAGEDREIHIVKLTDADAATMATSLAAMYRQQYGEKAAPGMIPVIQGITTSNSLLISSSAEQWKGLEKLIADIKEATVPTDLPITRIVALKHATAEEMATTLRQLFSDKPKPVVKSSLSSSSKSSSSSRSSSSSSSKKSKYGPSSPPPAVISGMGASGNPVTIAASVRNNSLVIVAMEEDHKRIDEVIKALDVESDEVDPIQMVRLESAEAVKLVEALRPLVPMDGSRPRVIVQADQATNSLLLRGPESERKAIEDMIAKLDKETQATAREFRMIPLKHVSASSLIPMLQQLYGDEPAKSINRPRGGSSSSYYYYYELQRQQQKSRTAQDPATKVIIAPAPGDRMLVIDAPRDKMEQIAKLVESMDTPDGPSQQQVRTYNLTTTNAGELAQSLQRMFSEDDSKPDGVPKPRFDATRTSNQLIVAATSADFEKIDVIIKEVEKKATIAVQTKTFRLKHADATEVAAVIETMLSPEKEKNSRSSSSGYGSGGYYRVYNYGEMTSEPKTVAASEPTIRVAALVATNDIVIQGSPEKIALAEELIKTFDTPEAAGMAVIEIVQLKNSQATSLAESINTMLAAKATRTSSSSSSRSSRSSSPAPARDTVTVTPEINSNSVLVRGPAAEVADVVKMIGKLDTQTIGSTMQLRVFRLKEADAASLAVSMGDVFEDILKQHGSQLGSKPPFSIAADNRTNSLVVSTTPAYFLLFEQLLNTLDRAPDRSDRDVRYFVLKNADAWDLGLQLETMYEDRRGTDKPVIQADIFANAITVIAKDADLTTIESVVAKVDKSAEDNSIQVRVIPMTGTGNKAKKMAEVLKNIYEQATDIEVNIGDRLPEDLDKPAKPKKQSSAAPKVAPKNEPAVEPKVEPATEDKPLTKAERRARRKANKAKKNGEQQDKPKKKNRKKKNGESSAMNPSPSGRGWQRPSAARKLTGEGGAQRRSALASFEESSLRSALTRSSLASLSQRERGCAATSGGHPLASLVVASIITAEEDAPKKDEKPNNVNIAVDEATNSLILSGTRDQLDDLERLILKFRDDDAADDADFRIYTIKHSDPISVAQIIDRLFNGYQPPNQKQQNPEEQQKQLQQQQQMGLQQQMMNLQQQMLGGQRGQNNQGNNQGNQLGLPQGVPNIPGLLQRGGNQGNNNNKGGRGNNNRNNPAAQMQAFMQQQQKNQNQRRVAVVADRRTSRVIVRADPTDLDLIGELVTQLDMPSTLASEIRVFTLQNTRARDVADNLRELVTPKSGSGAVGLQRSILIQQKLNDELKRLGKDPEAVDLASVLNVAANEQTNSVIVAAPGNAMGVIEEIITELDQSAATAFMPSVRMYPIQHAELSSLVTNLREIFASMTVSRGQGQGGQSSSAGKVVITGDPYANTVIVSASPTQHTIIEQVIKDIDKSQPGEAMGVTVYKVQYADATSVATTLNNTLNPGGQSTRVNPNVMQWLRGPRGGGGSSTTPGNASLRITADSSSNTLVVRATKEDHKQIDELLKQIDVAPATHQLVKIIPLKHADATSVASTISKMFANEQTASVQGNRFRTSSSRQSIVIEGDRDAKMLMVRADEETFERIKKLAADLDVETAGIVSTFVVLQNVHATDLAPALQKIAGSGDSRSALNVGSRTGGATSQQKTTVSADPGSNTIVMRGPADEVEGLKKMASQLDAVASESDEYPFIIPVKHGDAVEMAQIIRDLNTQSLMTGSKRGPKAPGLSVSADSRSNSLVVVTSTAMMVQLRLLVEQMDLITPRRGSLRVIQLQHADPGDLEKAIKAIYGGSVEVVGQGGQPATGGGGRNQTQQQPRNQPRGGGGGRTLPGGIPGGRRGPEGARGPEGPTGGKVTVSSLPQQRAILIDANDVDFEAIKKLAEMMDAAAAETQLKTRVVVLKNASNTRIATALNSMYSSAARSNVPEDKVNITALPGTDAVVVAAVKDRLDEIEDLIGQLDKKELTPKLAFKVFTLENTYPSKILPLVRQMLVKVAEVREGETIDIQGDERTRSLIVTARENLFDQVGKIIESLDTAPAHAATDVIIIQLKRADAARLAGVLNTALNPTTGGQITPEAKALQEQVRRLKIQNKDKKVVELDLNKPIKITSDPAQPDTDGSNSLIIASTEDNLIAMKALVTMMDEVPLGPDLAIRIIPLDHADATRIKGVVDALYTGENAGKMNEVNKPTLSVDVRTNSVVVSASDKTFLVLTALLQQLDKEQAIELRDIRVIPLKNAEASGLATVLQEMMDARVQRQESLGVKDAESMRVIVIAEPRSNSLIVGGTAEGFTLVTALAKELDEAGPALAGQVQLLPLEHANAGTLSVTLSALFDQRYAATTAPDVQRQKPIILADTRSNSLLVAANNDDSKVLTGLLKKMDVKLKDPSVRIEVLAMKHNDAGVVGPSIQRLFQARLQAMAQQGVQPAPQDQVDVETDSLSNALIVSASKENLDLIKELLTKVDVDPPAETGVVRLFPLKNADAQRVSQILQSLVQQGLYKPGKSAAQNPIEEAREKVAVEVDTRTNVLIVSASAENFAVIEQVIAKIDATEDFGALGSIRMFVLKHADATRLAPTLQQFFDSKQAAEQAVAPSTGVRALKMSITPDARTNTLLVAGSKEGFTSVEAMIKELDVDQVAAASDFKIFALKQATASALQPTLQQLFDQRVARGDTKDQVTIVSDSRSNSLIVGASAQDMKIADSIIKQLDINPSTKEGNIRVFPLKRGDATKIATTLRNLYQSDGGTTGGDTAGGVTISVDERINAIVVSAGKADLTRIGEMIKQLDATELTKVTEIRVFTLEHGDSTEMAQLLNDTLTQKPTELNDENQNRQTLLQFINKDAKGEELITRAIQEGIIINADRRTNSLIVTAPLDYMPLLGRLIKSLDQTSPREAEIKVFTLKNADAQQMADVLTQLFRMEAEAADDKRAVKYTLQNGEKAGPSATVGTAAESALHVTVDTRTNSLLVGGTTKYVGLCSEIINSLDSSPAQERKTQVYRLRHGQSADIETALRTFLDQERDRLTRALGDDNLGAAQRLLEKEVALVAEETSNSLLVSASPRYFGEMEKMINELDSPKPQVLIQVMLAEVMLDDGKDLGFEWQYTGDLNATKATVQAGTNFGVEQAFNSMGGLGVAISGSDLSMFFRALASQGKLEVMSRPQILASDNQPASINVGQRVPFITNSRITDNGDVVNTVQYEDVGILLNVTARLSDDGFVRMEVSPEISSISSSTIPISEGVNAIVVNNRSAETTVTVQDGHTIVIGGLITTEDDDRETKVPIVGDIPILGNLFRSVSKSKKRSELLIVLTPHVLRTVDEADEMTKKQQERFKLLQEHGVGVTNDVLKNPNGVKKENVTKKDAVPQIDWDAKKGND